jgi:hypothetical protein
MRCVALAGQENVPVHDNICGLAKGLPKVLQQDFGHVLALFDQHVPAGRRVQMEQPNDNRVGDCFLDLDLRLEVFVALVSDRNRVAILRHEFLEVRVHVELNQFRVLRWPWGGAMMGERACA